MSNIGNKESFARNLKFYIEASGKDRRELANTLGFPYSTVTDWLNAKKYPRIDRIEKLADYFGILKSDLIEDKTEERAGMQKKADTISDAVLKMKTNPEFLSLVEKLIDLDSSQIRSVDSMISAFVK